MFSEKYGQKSFNIQVEERTACLEKLFLEGDYEVQPDDDESTVNMAERYANIEEAFPEEIKRRGLSLLSRLAEIQRHPRGDHGLLGRQCLHDFRVDE